MSIKEEILNSGLRRVHFVFIEMTSCKHCKRKQVSIINIIRLPMLESAIDYGFEKTGDYPVRLKLSNTAVKVEAIVSSKIIICRSCLNKVKRILGGM